MLKLSAMINMSVDKTLYHIIESQKLIKFVNVWGEDKLRLTSREETRLTGKTLLRLLLLTLWHGTW